MTLCEYIYNNYALTKLYTASIAYIATTAPPGLFLEWVYLPHVNYIH